MTVCWGATSDCRRAFVAMVALRCVALEREACARILRRFAAFATVEPRPPGRAGSHAIKLLSRSMCKALRFGGACGALPSFEEESDIIAGGAPPGRLKSTLGMTLRQGVIGAGCLSRVVSVSALRAPVGHVNNNVNTGKRLKETAVVLC